MNDKYSINDRVVQALTYLETVKNSVQRSDITSALDLHEIEDDFRLACGSMQKRLSRLEQRIKAFKPEPGKS